MKSCIDSVCGLSSVFNYHDHVYAARFVNWDEPSELRVYKHSGDSWTKVRSFKVMTGWAMLSVQNDQVKCCSFDEHKIAVYSLTGQLLRTYGGRGSGDAGKFNCPYIYSHDGIVLIADRLNGRLQVMSEQGEFSVLQLQPPVTSPLRAVLFKNHVFVASWDKKAIYKYSC